MSTTRTVRCPSCRSEFAEKDIVDLDCCPSCSSEVTPQYTDEDIQLTLNWSDCRLLANWASNWAETQYSDDMTAQQELSLILDKIRRLRPPEGEPLTVEDILEELRRQGFDPVKLNSLDEDVAEAVESGSLWSDTSAGIKYVN